MRAFVRIAVVLSATAFAPVLFGAGIGAFAQGNAPAAAAAAPKEVSLTQKQIDGAIAAQKDIKEAEGKAPESQSDKPDPKLSAQIEAAAKKNGFSSVAELSDVSSTIGFVMAGIDPDTKKYVGPTTVLKKQIDEVQADKSLSPKEKKEQVSEMNEAMKAVSGDKPSQGNIDLVTANYDKLSASMAQDQ